MLCVIGYERAEIQLFVPKGGAFSDQFYPKKSEKEMEYKVNGWEIRERPTDGQPCAETVLT